MHYAGKTPVEWKIQMRIARSALTIKPLKSDFHHNCIPQFSLCLQILTYRHSLAQSHAVSHPPTDTHACSHSLWLSFTCALFLSHTHSMRQSQDECSVIAGKKQSHNRKSGAAALTNIHKIARQEIWSCCPHQYSQNLPEPFALPTFHRRTCMHTRAGCQYPSWSCFRWPDSC